MSQPSSSYKQSMLSQCLGWQHIGVVCGLLALSGAAGIEPSRVFRRPFGLSHAAVSSFSRAAFTTPTGGRNMRPKSIVGCWPPMACLAR